MQPEKKKLKKRVSTTIKKKSKKRVWLRVLLITTTILLSLVLIAVAGFFFLMTRYYKQMNYIGEKNPDPTLAMGDTLPPDDDETETGTDSPIEAIESLNAFLDWVLQDYSYQDNINEEDFSTNGDLPSSNQPSVAQGDDTATKASDEALGTVPAATKAPGGNKNPLYDPTAAGNQGSGLVGTGVGDAQMPQVGQDPDVTNILLIGVDTRQNNNSGRSDCMIVMSINRKTKKIILTSFLRDSYVAIPGRGNNRLNAAHAYGGATLLMQTIEANFGLHIDYFARVNFFSFIDIVEAANGVNIMVDSKELPYVNSYLKSLNNSLGGFYQNLLQNDLLTTPGMLLLNGRQALAYSRIRYVGSDYARTARQREVILAVVSQMRQMSVLELDTFLGKALPLISTNLTQGVASSLVLSVPSLLGYQIIEHRVPADGTGVGMTIDKKSVIAVDIIANRNLLNQIIYER